jgi:hypothetical protein
MRNRCAIYSPWCLSVLYGTLAQRSPTAAMIITTSIRPGTWCIRPPVARSSRSARRSAAMAASAFQSTTVGRARITVASPTGIELAGWRPFSAIRLARARRPQSVQAELEQASSEQATTASGQDQHLTRSDSDKGAAIIPIDAQPLGTHGFGRAAGRYDREDFRPSSIGRTRSGLWEPPRP